jgi:hypothetical protein
MVIQNLQSDFLGDYAGVVRDLHDSRREFELLSFCHEKRSHNKEAHNLARSVVLDGHGRQVWLVEPPAGLCILFEIEF